MKYKVIETQEHTEPKEDWTIVGEFGTEAEAIQLMDIHYQTQIGVFAEDMDGERPQCVCESCAEGWRPIDRMALVVEVQEVK